LGLVGKLLKTQRVAKTFGSVTCPQLAQRIILPGKFFHLGQNVVRFKKGETLALWRYHTYMLGYGTNADNRGMI